MGEIAPRIVVLAAASLIGVAVAAETGFAIALLAGLAFAVVALVDLRLGLVAWVPLTFFDAVGPLNLAGKAAGLVLAALWLGTVVVRAREAPAARELRPILIVLAMLLTWLALSASWSVDVGRTVAAFPNWLAVGLLFVIVADRLTGLRWIRLAAGAIIGGAIASIVFGVLQGPSPLGQQAGPDRLEGGAGDPNYLALGLLPAVILALGLLPAAQRPSRRALTVACAFVLLAGLGATASRGALVAVAVTLAVAFVVMRHRRRPIAVTGSALVLAAAATSVVAPGVWERMTTDEDGGSGRRELWAAAWRIVEERPFSGVGLGNFATVAGDHVREMGPMYHVRLFDQRTEVHNLYLELVAENGLGALLLFLALVAMCLSASWAAARRFDLLGDRDGAALSYAVLFGTFSMLVAFFFLSNAVDRRFWFVLALGPALLRTANRTGVAGGDVPDPLATPAAPTTQEGVRR